MGILHVKLSILTFFKIATMLRKSNGPLIILAYFALNLYETILQLNFIHQNQTTCHINDFRKFGFLKYVNNERPLIEIYHVKFLYLTHLPL